MPKGIYKRKPLAERFWKFVNKHGKKMPGMKTVCWEWTGAHGNFGHGVIKMDGVQRSAHSIAWFFETGKLPELCGLHTCDNPPCVRFSHLFEGSKADNIADMHAKGRAASRKGSKNGRAKLTETIVVAIRQELAAGQAQRSLAIKYRTCQQNISRINQGKIW